jgi:hypothetical protein
MKEIMFLIEDDPEWGYNAQALGYSIFTEGETGSCPRFTEQAL